MLNLFEKPITCDLKPSVTLSGYFLVIALIPASSVLLLFQRFPLSMILLIVAIAITAFYYISQYSYRIRSTSIVRIVFHGGLAKVTLKNGTQNMIQIRQVTMSPYWLLFEFQNYQHKLIIDRESTNISTYRRLRRKVTQFNLER